MTMEAQTPTSEAEKQKKERADAKEMAGTSECERSDGAADGDPNPKCSTCIVDVADDSESADSDDYLELLAASDGVPVHIRSSGWRNIGSVMDFPSPFLAWGSERAGERPSDEEIKEAAVKLAQGHCTGNGGVYPIQAEDILIVSTLRKAS